MTDRIRLNEGNRRWWTLGAMCFALFMIMLDNTVVNVALPSIQRDLDASLSGARVDGQRLHAHLRRAARHRRPPGRHLRPPQDVPLRRGRVRALERGDRLRARPTPGWSAGRARPGRRRGVHDARDAVDHHQRVPARRSAARRSAPGPACRALALAIGPVVGGFLTEYVTLAGDLLPQPAGRRRRRRRRRCSPTRESRDETVARTVDFARHRDAHGRPGGARAGARRGQRLGLGLARDHRRCSRVAVVGLAAFVVDRAARAVPMVDFTLLPLADVPRRERRRASSSRFAMLAMFFFTRALHAEHPRLLAAARPACASCPRR